MSEKHISEFIKPLMEKYKMESKREGDNMKISKEQFATEVADAISVIAKKAYQECVEYVKEYGNQHGERCPCPEAFAMTQLAACVYVEGLEDADSRGKPLSVKFITGVQYIAQVNDAICELEIDAN